MARTEILHKIAQFSAATAWPTAQHWAPPIALACTLALVAFLYAPTLDDPFHGDDFVAFTDFETKGFWDYSRDVFLFKDTNFYWRPLGDIFHYSLYLVFGFDAFAFRVAALAVFLATLVCIYAFCHGERLGAWTGVIAALIFGVMPSHVVSVSWVTNTSRLTAALFLMLSLLALQRTRDSRHQVLWEFAAFLAFMVAILSDEVTAALVAVPLLYASWLVRPDLRLKSTLVRVLVYGGVVAILVPLQFTHTIDNEARLIEYGFGPHMPESFWVAASQLSMPLGAGGPLDVFLHKFPNLEWAAGLATLATLLWLTAFGSRTTRFLALWCLIAILPFSLWKPLNMSPRYVFLAAMPLSILASWALVRGAALFATFTASPRWPALTARAAVAGVALPSAALLLLALGSAVQERNEAWSEETGRYGTLRRGLEEFGRPAPGARLVVYYGEWPDFWATSTARALYGDSTLQVVVVPRDRLDAPVSPQRNDVVLYMLGDRLVPTAASRR